MGYWVRDTGRGDRRRGRRRATRTPSPLSSRYYMSRAVALVATLVAVAGLLAQLTNVEIHSLLGINALVGGSRIYYVATLNPLPAGRVVKVWRFGGLKVYKAVLRAEEVVTVSRSALAVFSPSQPSISVLAAPYTVFTGGANSQDIKQWHRKTGEWSGRSVVVCVIDTGIDYLHPDLRGAVRALVSMFYVSEGGTYLTWIVGVNGTLEEAWELERELHATYGVYAWMDDNGHGTHVSGIIASRGITGYPGLAPGAELVVVRAFDVTGSAPLDRVLEALEWVWNNTDRFRIRMLNLSWGSPGDNRGLDPVSVVVDYMAERLGLLVVAAAGNSGNVPFTVNIPACARRALAVGAFDPSAMKIAEFSSWGPTIDLRIKVDFVGAGVNVISCKPVTVESYIERTHPELVVDKYHMALSGTSMAAPCVSAVAAAYCEKLSSENVKPTYTALLDALIENSVRLNRFGKDFVSGWGAPLIRS